MASSLSAFPSPVAATRRRRSAASTRCAAGQDDPEAHAARDTQLLLRGLSLLPESAPQRRTRLQGELAVLNEKARACPYHPRARPAPDASALLRSCEEGSPTRLARGWPGCREGGATGS